MSPDSLSFKFTAVLLAALLLSSGCTTTSPIPNDGLRGALSSASTHKIVLQDQEGNATRLDPNSEVRFILGAYEATPWIRGRDLWISKVGISFEVDRGVHFLQWQEITAAEVRNLSGGKTFGAMLLTVVVLGVLVVMIAAKSGGGGGNSISGGKSKSPRTKRSWRRRSMGRAGGIHLHLPLIIAAPHPTYRSDVPPPPRELRPQNSEIKQAFDQIDAEPAQLTPTTKPVKASLLFGGPVRRRSIIQFMAQTAGGGDLAQLESPSASVLVGLRLREVIDIGGGFRELVTTVPSGSASLPCFIGVGRLGVHLPLDTAEIFAIPFSVDAGAGQNVLYHLKLNLGLRIQLPYRFSVGLMPFNPTFTAFKETGPMVGARKWTFPTTLEVGFSY